MFSFCAHTLENKGGGQGTGRSKSCQKSGGEKEVTVNRFSLMIPWPPTLHLCYGEHTNARLCGLVRDIHETVYSPSPRGTI